MQREEETRRGRVNDDQAFNLLFTIFKSAKGFHYYQLTSKFGSKLFTAPPLAIFQFLAIGYYVAERVEKRAKSSYSTDIN